MASRAFALRRATPALAPTLRSLASIRPASDSLARLHIPRTALSPRFSSPLPLRAFSTTAIRRQSTKLDPEIATIARDSDQADVLIIGAGPAGLSAAIRLKQIANESGNEDLRVVVLEKAGDIGGHIVSGAVIQPDAIEELLPNWLDPNDEGSFYKNATPVTQGKMRFLTKNGAWWIPEPPQMHNHGNYIVSLNQLVAWMGEKAEELGVEVYPGFAGAEVLYNSDGSVKGVATNDLGIGRDGKMKANFERGMEFHARVTLFAEGCHGSLTKQVSKKFNLRRDSDPQTYGLGIKEVWEIRPEKFEKGLVAHSMGWPLPMDTYGGSWMYHFGENMVSIGLVVGLVSLLHMLNIPPAMSNIIPRTIPIHTSPPTPNSSA